MTTVTQKIKRINDFLEVNGINLRLKKAPKSLSSNAIKFDTPVIFVGRSERYELDFLDDMRLSCNRSGNSLIEYIQKINK